MPESALAQRTESGVEKTPSKWSWGQESRSKLMAGLAAITSAPTPELARALAGAAAKRAASEAAGFVAQAKVKASEASDALKSLAKTATRGSLEAKAAVLEAADRQWRRGAATKQFNLLKNQRPNRPDQLAHRGCDTGSLDALLALDAEPYRR